MCVHLVYCLLLALSHTRPYRTGASLHNFLIGDHRHHSPDQHNHLICGVNRHCLFGSCGPRHRAVAWLTVATYQRSSTVVHSCGLDSIECGDAGRLAKDVHRITSPVCASGGGQAVHRRSVRI